MHEGDIERPSGRWLATSIGLASAATALGLTRFGYTVLLPAMRIDLDWSYATAGTLNTANALGYLVGAMVSPLLLRRWSLGRCLRPSAALTAVALLGCAATPDPLHLCLLRAVGGASAAVLFVVGGLLAAQLADASPRPGTVLAIFYAGVGPGVLLSALLAPPVLADPATWRVGWLVLGGLTAACAAAAVRSARRIRPVRDAARRASPARAALGWAALSFALFGLGYIPFMTFVVAYWRESGGSITVVTLLWAILAAAATLSGWVLRRWLDEPRSGLVKLLLLVTVGASLPLVSTGLLALSLSSALFGAGFLAVTAAITQLIRETRPHHQRHHVLAVFTSVFAAGQVVGPLLTGWLADHLGLRGGLWAACGFLVLAVLAAVAQRRDDPEHSAARTSAARGMGPP